MSLKHTRDGGGGRKKSAHEGGLSLQIFSCVVHDCDYEGRSDKLRNHYRSKVIWLTNGNPAPNWSATFKNVRDEDRKNHTKYFIEHGYAKESLPQYKNPIKVPPREGFFGVVAKRQKTTTSETSTTTTTDMTHDIPTSSTIDPNDVSETISVNTPISPVELNHPPSSSTTTIATSTTVSTENTDNIFDVESDWSSPMPLSMITMMI